MSYDTIQWIIAILVLVMCAWWVLRRISRKSDGCGCGCDDCPAKRDCHKEEKKD